MYEFYTEQKFQTINIGDLLNFQFLRKIAHNIHAQAYKEHK